MTDRRPTLMSARVVSVHMSRVEHAVAVEAERDAEESLDSGVGFDSRRELVGFLAVLLLVIALAAATTVVLLPA